MLNILKGMKSQCIGKNLNSFEIFMCNLCTYSIYLSASVMISMVNHKKAFLRWGCRTGPPGYEYLEKIGGQMYDITKLTGLKGFFRKKKTKKVWIGRPRQ